MARVGAAGAIVPALAVVATLAAIVHAGQGRSAAAVSACLAMGLAALLATLVGRGLVLVNHDLRRFVAAMESRVRFVPVALVWLAATAAIDALPRGNARRFSLATAAVLLALLPCRRFRVAPPHDYDWPRWAPALERALQTGTDVIVPIPPGPLSVVAPNHVRWSLRGEPERAKVVTTLRRGDEVRQPFVADCSRLTEVDVAPAPPNAGLDVAVVDTAGDLVAAGRAVVDGDAVWSRLVFPPLGRSFAETYALRIRVATSGDVGVGLLGLPVDGPGDLRAEMNGVPLHGALVLRLGCRG